MSPHERPPWRIFVRQVQRNRADLPHDPPREAAMAHPREAGPRRVEKGLPQHPCPETPLGRLAEAGLFRVNNHIARSSYTAISYP